MYWYGVSSRMKVFIDRLTDLITIRKEDGRKLKGMQLLLIYHNNGPDAKYLEKMIVNICEYLGITFIGSCHFDM